MRLKSKTNHIYNKISQVIIYSIVPLFFIILYFLMTETYEDILHHSSNSQDNVLVILKSIYSFIPRIGEFYQRVATHFMTMQLSFGLDLIFRLITAIMAILLIYNIARFILKKKLSLNNSDPLVFFSIFAAIMISPLSEIFTARFSYAHNYVLALLITMYFIYLHRFDQKNTKINIIIAALVGFCFGISNEIIPVAYLIIILSYLSYLLFSKKITIKNLLKNKLIQIAAFLGVIFGLIFFYNGGGIGSRSGGAYAEIYNYTSVTGIFNKPIYTLSTLNKHFWYNLRYLMWSAPLILISIAAVYMSRIYKKEKDNDLFWQLIILTFVVLFMGASSMLALHDDIYVRFLSYPIIGIFIIFSLGLKAILNMIQSKNIKFKTIYLNIATIFLGFIMIADLTMFFYRYNKIVRPELTKVRITKNSGPEIDEINIDTEMKPSFFRWKQFTPFNWGVSNYRYLKNGSNINYK